MTSDKDEPTGQREFLARILEEGAGRLGATPVGEVVFGWRDRTIGSAAIVEGSRRWLRATAEHRDWAFGEVWTGNLDAAELTRLPKPDLVDRVEWAEPPVVMYAELLTYVPDPPCSLTPELTVDITPSEAWWSDLRTAVDDLAAQPTHRGRHDPETYLRELEDLYQRRLDLPAPRLRTEHTDLHWANLTQPHLWLLDWEHWGTAPAGYGPATLYCHSLLVPEAATRIRELFADLLDTPGGHAAQLGAAAHILDRAHRMGDYMELRPAVREHAWRLLELAGRR